METTEGNDDYIKCTIAHVDSPGKFFIWLTTRSGDEYGNLREKMYKFYFHREDSHNLGTLGVDMKSSYVVAPFDGYFVRLKRLKNFPGRALAIDLGLVVPIEEDSLLFLGNEFSVQKYPAMAVRCSIYDVKPRGEERFWSQDAIDLFKEEVRKGRDFEVIRRGEVIELPDEEAQAYPVEVYYHKTVAESAFAKIEVKKLSLSQTLLKNKLAIPTLYMEILDFDSFSNENIHDVSTDIEEEDRIDEIGLLRDNDEGSPETGGAKTRSIFPKNQVQLQPGSRHLVMFTTLTDQNELYVQLEREQYSRMDEELRDAYKNGIPASIGPGDPIIFKLNNRAVYRGLVLEEGWNEEEALVPILCVDFGCIDFAERQKIRQIPESLLKTPEFCIKVKLENSDDISTETLFNVMSKEKANNEFLMRPIRLENSIWMVELFRKNKDGYIENLLHILSSNI